MVTFVMKSKENLDKVSPPWLNRKIGKFGDIYKASCTSYEHKEVALKHYYFKKTNILAKNAYLNEVKVYVSHLDLSHSQFREKLESMKIFLSFMGISSCSPTRL